MHQKHKLTSQKSNAALDIKLVGGQPVPNFDLVDREDYPRNRLRPFLRRDFLLLDREFDDFADQTDQTFARLQEFLGLRPAA